MSAKLLRPFCPGWERIEASSAAQALELLASRDIDVVIADYNMPAQNGLDLIEELRRQRPELPIAIATANVQDEVIARARAANAAFVTQIGARPSFGSRNGRFQ